MHLSGPFTVAVLMAVALLVTGARCAAAPDTLARTADTQPAARALDALRRAWFAELDDLTATTRALAVADDTYEFVTRPNIPYVDAHYARESLSAERISTVLIINRKGTPLFWRRVNLGANRGFADAKAFLDELPPLPPAGAPGVPSLAGAARLVQGPSLVVAMPIYAATGSGESLGWLIAVRALDAAQWLRYEERAHVAAEVLDPVTSTSPADLEAALREPLAPVTHVEGSRIRGLMAMPDLEGKPFLVFSVLQPLPPLPAKPPAPASTVRRWLWLWLWLAPAAIFAGVVGFAFWGVRRGRRIDADSRTTAQAPGSEVQVDGPQPAANAGGKPEHEAIPSFPSGPAVAQAIVVDSAAARREELRARLLEMNLVFCYQPQIDLRTGRVAGVEALLFSSDPNERHPTLEFVADVEAAGLGFVLAQRWIQEACRNQRIWLQHVGHEFPVSVPVSQRTLEDPGFLPFLLRILAEYELAPPFLELEVPEYALGGSAASLRALEDVHAAGVSIAIDRFNSARSSLRLLTVVPVGKLRIDPALVRKIGSATQEAALFDGIIGAARGLGIIVCATGVDSPDLVAGTLRHGRPLAQGEALARAISGDEFLVFLRGSASDTASLPPLQIDDAIPQP